jgi:DNA-binding SARP family transcriptional activator/lipopolysaccharide biosynthesis regulator YciM
MPVLRLFGVPTLAHDDGRLVGGRASQRHRIALLALLARAPSGYTRDKLLSLLWPESDAERGRNLLNESIYVLRRALGEEVILSNGDDLRLGLGSLTVDVSQFEESLDRGELARAVEIYVAPFMDGFFLTRSGEFERWLDREREALATRVRQAVESLAAVADDRGDAAGAVILWRRLLTESPLDARLVLRLMQSLVAAGNRAGALEQARIHAALQAADVGLPPDPQIETLAQRIRDGWTPGPRSEPSSAPPVPNDTTVHAGAPASTLGRPRMRPVWVLAAAGGLAVTLVVAVLVVRPRLFLVNRDGSRSVAIAVPSGGAAATAPPVAAQLYERGRAHLVHHREPDLREAIAAFDSAIAIDSRFAGAHAGLAVAAAEMHLRFASVDEAPAWGRRAVDEARAALQLDSTLAEAHEALAAVDRKSEFDWEGTIAESRRALELDPRAAQPWFYMAGALYHLGLLSEAEHAVHRGLDAQPTVDRAEALRTLGTVAVAAGRYTEAASLLQDVQRLSDRPVSDTHLATAYFYAGEHDRADKLLEALLAARSASAATRAAASLASFVAAEGDRDRARLLVARAERGMVDHHVAYSIGVAYAQLGDPASAVRWLRTAAETGFRCYPWYTRDPLLAPLRNDVSYRALEEELKRQWLRDRLRFAKSVDIAS